MFSRAFFLLFCLCISEAVAVEMTRALALPES